MSATRLSVAEASAHVLAGVAPLADETVELRDTLGRVLARDVASPVSLPPWDNASMDGFAVRASDVRGASASNPVRLRVVETIAARRRDARSNRNGDAHHDRRPCRRALWRSGSKTRPVARISSRFTTIATRPQRASRG